MPECLYKSNLQRQFCPFLRCQFPQSFHPSRHSSVCRQFEQECLLAFELWCSRFLQRTALYRQVHKQLKIVFTFFVVQSERIPQFLLHGFVILFIQNVGSNGSESVEIDLARICCSEYRYESGIVTIVMLQVPDAWICTGRNSYFSDRVLSRTWSALPCRNSNSSSAELCSLYWIRCSLSCPNQTSGKPSASLHVNEILF